MDPTGLEPAAGTQTVFDWVVQEIQRGTRLDKFLLATGQFISRHQIQKLIETGSVLVDGAHAKAACRLRPSQAVRHLQI